MNKIIVNHGSFKVKEVELEHGTLTVGRAADNDLKLDDSAVSSHHAKLVTFFNVTYIEDLNSTNGTLVNGRPVKKYTLHTGDIVLLGKHQLLFQGARMEEAAGSDSTIVMSASEKNDALATAAEMHKPLNGAQSPQQKPAIKPSKYPMKQEQEEPIGRLTESELKPATTPSSFVPARRPVTSGGSQNSDNAAVENKFNSAMNRSSVFDVTKTPPAFKPSFPETSNNNVGVAAKSSQSVTDNAAKPVEPVANKNPFQAAFPDESADKIDVNQVPSIGKFSEDEHEAAVVTADAEVATENKPEHSNANIYSIQALSQANEAENGKSNFRANIPVGGDESLLIPAFAKKLNNPADAAASKLSYANVSNLNSQNEHKISPEIEKLFEEEEKAQKSKPARKVLEDPSVNMGEEYQGMTPVGVSESNRISQYHQRAAAAHGEIPAVGDRTLLKQIITGDRDFSPSRNKFEVIQIVLGVVIFIIIALIAVASL